MVGHQLYDRFANGLLTHVAVRVEIEYYSIAYFDRITTFEALYRRTSRAHTCCVNVVSIHEFSHRIWAPVRKCDRIWEKNHFAQFWMYRLQSCVSPQYCRWSKLNVGGLYRGHCCSNEPEMKPFSKTTRTVWGGVNGIVDHVAISRKWHCYQSAYLGSGES